MRHSAVLVILLLLGSCSTAAEDLYEALEVSDTADAETIKRAYKKAAKMWHPDLHSGAEKDKANEKMKVINEAKDTLLDPERRALYDRVRAKISTINAFATQATGSGLPSFVLVYVTCPAYLGYLWGMSPLTSLACTAILVSHVPLLAACFLFYKYSLWGPVPVHQRGAVKAVSFVVRIVMLGVLAMAFLVFMLSAHEYLPWLTVYVMLPLLATKLVDVFLQEERVERRKGASPLSRRVVTTRPSWVPWFFSWKGLTDSLGEVWDRWDHDPVERKIPVKQGFEVVLMRKMDVEMLEKREQEEKDKAERRREAEMQKRLEAERQMSEMDAKAAKQRKEAKIAVPKSAPQPKEPSKAAAPTAAPSKEKKGVNANVTHTGTALWTAEQQQKLEKALKKYPGGTRDRWDRVSEEVNGKTPKQCAERFKELASLRAQVVTSK